ncbi:MAG: hypothetical protein Q7S09_05545 [bacterium]|nr:hypothetical protein [bacterium]
MPLWAFFAVAAYAINAAVAVSDKYFLTRRIPNAISYGFWVGVFGLVFVLAIPFGFSLPSPMVLVAALASGAAFTVFLLVLFWSIEHGDVSRVVPTMGVVFPLATMFLASFFIHEKLESTQFLAFCVLVASSVLLSFYGYQKGDHHVAVFFGAVLAGLLSALSSVLAKYVFEHHEPFISGFIWMRLAGGAMALTLLLVPRWRRRIFGTTRDPQSHIGFLVLVRIGAGLSFIVLNYSIALGSVTLVNALKGAEYAVIFLIMIVLSKFLPGVVKETLNPKIVIAKCIAISGIIIGLLLLRM